MNVAILIEHSRNWRDVRERFEKSETPPPLPPAILKITFFSDGVTSTTSAVIEDSPFVKTTKGACIVDEFRRARVSAFVWHPMTVERHVTIDAAPAP